MYSNSCAVSQRLVFFKLKFEHIFHYYLNQCLAKAKFPEIELNVFAHGNPAGNTRNTGNTGNT